MSNQVHEYIIIVDLGLKEVESKRRVDTTEKGVRSIPLSTDDRRNPDVGRYESKFSFLI